MKVIASCCISNTCSLNILEVDEEEETVTVSLNNDPPHKYKVHYTNKGPYFNFCGHRYYLNEFIRV